MRQERLLKSEGHEEIRATCSFYKLIDKYFNGELPGSPIHRIFSLARREGVKFVIIEEIPCGLNATYENLDLQDIGLHVSNKPLLRISFWDSPDKSNDSLIGYAILKYGPILKHKEKWRVFESVFRKYRHKNNCVHTIAKFSVRVLGKIYDIAGVLYAQQNGYNCCCAHVALRSLLASYVRDGDITYRTINRYADYKFDKNGGCSIGPDGRTHTGLTKQQIAKVLERAEVPYKQYNTCDARGEIQAKLHAGVESGTGVLLAINKYGGHKSGHAISLYGHTFNTDSWLAFCETQKKLHSYIQGSHMLASSFLMHDDNFGCNYCVPKVYIKDNLNGIAFVLLPKGYKISGDLCLAKAKELLTSLRRNQHLFKSIGNNYWLNVCLIPNTHLFLRPIPIERQDYITHIYSAADGEGRNLDIPERIKNKLFVMPNKLWMIEFFNYDLIGGNNSKLGEMLFSAFNPSITKCELLRICGCFGFNFDEISNMSMKMVDPLFSHTKLFSR